LIICNSNISKIFIISQSDCDLAYLFKVVVIMTANTIEEVLSNIKKKLDVEEVTLISRSGMHIGGDVPNNAHLETFVAMSAILLGAAETATSELDEELSHVVVELKKSRVLIINDGPSALLAIKMSQESNIEKILKGIEGPMEELDDLL